MSVLRWDVKDEGQVRSNRTGQELTVKVVIICSDVTDSLATLKRDLPELQRWQPHPDQVGFFVDEFSADQVTGSAIWNGTIRYVDTIIRNPLDEPAKLMGVRTETLPGATIVDYEGKLILNSAGDIVSPIDKPERIRIFTYQKKLPSIALWLFDLEDVANSNAMQIAGQSCQVRQLLLRKVDFGNEEEAEGVVFRTCNIELAYRKSKWIHRYPSVGFNQVVQEREFQPGPQFNQQVTRKRTILIKGQPPTQEQLLDADGKWIEKPEPSDLVILEAKVYSEGDLSVLPLT